MITDEDIQKLKQVFPTKDEDLTKEDVKDVVVDTIYEVVMPVFETMATKEDLKYLATKEDLNSVKEDLSSVKDRLESLDRKVDRIAEKQFEQDSRITIIESIPSIAHQIKK